MPDLRDVLSIRGALSLAITAEVGGHVGEYCQAHQDPVKALHATRINGDVHEGCPGQEQPAQKAPNETVKGTIDVDWSKDILN
jgi:hypothetical protein